MGVPFKIINVNHLDKGTCPTCGEPGIFDLESPQGTILPEGTNWIWYSSLYMQWECGECWLK